MRKVLFIWISIICIAPYFQVLAQDRVRDQIRLQEHLLYKDGKVYQVNNDVQSPVQSQQQLKNGLRVNPNGVCQLQDQKKFQLKNGECLDMDGNRYKSQNDFRQQMQFRSQAMNQEHLLYANGNLMRNKNQERVQVNEKIILENGTVVNPDGSYQLKDGNKFQLKEGECMDMDGNIYQSHQHFRDKMEAQMRNKYDRNMQDRNKPKMRQGAPKQRQSNR